MEHALSAASKTVVAEYTVNTVHYIQLQVIRKTKRYFDCIIPEALQKWFKSP